MKRGLRAEGPRWVVAASAALVAAGAAVGGIDPQAVLLLYNSEEPDSQAVRDMYVAAHPGILEFDLDNAAVNPGTIDRADYLSMIRAPLLNHLNGLSGGPDISSQVIVIVTTRGLPARVRGTDEFQVYSSWASLESELALIQQDLELPGSGTLNFRYWGPVDNPYHQRFNQPMSLFSRANIKVQRTFTRVAIAAGIDVWQATGLTPGDIYLVCRVDAAPSPGGTALQNIQALLDRSATLQLNPVNVQVVLDEYASSEQLDDDPLGSPFPGLDDYDFTTAYLGPQGYVITHDQTSNFVEGHELADQSRPVVVLGSYGENHDLDGSENPPGDGVYVATYTFHPAAMFTSYESFNGNSIVNGQQRADHQQVLDFIAQGGSFTIGSTREPFTFAAADMFPLARNMLLHGLTFAEAAYTACPALSWQTTPVGDPLAVIEVFTPPNLDLNGDGEIDADDVYVFTDAPIDINGDFTVDEADRLAMLEAVREGEAADVLTGG